MFVEYESEVSAQEAVSQLNGYRLDKSHSFKVNMFSDFDKYRDLNLTSSDIDQPIPYKNPGNLLWWLQKPECFDQFCLLYGDIFTTVYSNTPGQSTQLKSREVIVIVEERNLFIFLKKNFKKMLEMDRDPVSMVAEGHLLGHISRSWHCIVGRRRV